MTTYIKVKLNKSDGQTNICKYRVSAHAILKKQNDISKAKLKFHVKTSVNIFDIDVLTFNYLFIEGLLHEV